MPPTKSPGKHRRAKGEGTLYLRPDGYWIATITTRRATGGQRHRRTFSGRTKSEVTRKVALHKEKHGGLVVGISSYDLRALLAAWIVGATGRRGAWAATTKATYETAAAHVYSAEIADVRLDLLDALDLADFLAGLARAKIGEPMRAKVYRMLRAALGSAVARQHGLRHNPMLDVDPVAEPKGDVRPATQAEVKRLVAAAANERLGSLFAVLAATGLRPGEAYALRWDAVDFDARVIHVRSTMSEIAGKRALKRPKTAGSVRIVDLAAIALGALRQRSAIAAKERHGSAYVWPQIDGEPLRRRNVERAWARIRTAAELPATLRIKDLRHTHASLMAAAGVHPLAVARQLGHTSAKMTLDRYSHAYDGSGRGAVKQFDSLMAGKPSKTAGLK
ncbi:MAG: tyrosine-type recombinase/integrase [Gammaproteobacteria bacterium]